MNIDRSNDGRPGRRLALAAVVLAVALVPAAGAAHARDGPTAAQCRAAWDGSEASKHCPFSGNQFWIRASNGECSVTTRCRKSGGLLPSSIQTVTGDLEDMRDLDSCDGRLQIGACSASVSPASDLDKCLAAWRESSASRSCPWLGISRQFSMTVSGGKCRVSTTCTRSNQLGTPRQVVTGDLEDMRNLDNCGGRLAIGCNDAAEAAARAALAVRCLKAWNGSEASRKCGSSYGAHSVSASGQQCHVSTSCGTPAGAFSIHASPGEVKRLHYCNNRLRVDFCPIAVTLQNCKDAWKASSASGTCDATGGTHSVSVAHGQCSVASMCQTGINLGSIGVKRASFRGTVEQMKTLSNCHGALRTGSC